MAIGFSQDYTHIKSDGLASWKVKRSGDTGHYSLGQLEDGKVKGEVLTEESSLLKNLPVSLRFQASAKCVNTDETTMIKSLDSLSTSGLNHIITAANGATFTGDFGTELALVCDADMDKNMYVEVKAEGIVLVDHSSYPDWGTIVAAPSPGSPVSGDTLYALNSLPTTRNTAGVRLCQVKLHSGGSNEDMGSVRNFKLRASTIVQKDGFQAPRCYGLWQLDVEFDQMQTSTEFPLLGPIQDADFSFTLACGYVFNVGNNVGLSWMPSLDTNTKNIAYTHWKLTGSIQSTAWDALWS